jgi:hypothetical protein
MTMKLKLTNTIFVLEATYSEFQSAKSAGLNYTGFKWNRERRQWESPHVIAASRVRKSYRALTGNELEMTPEATAFYAAEVERTKSLPRCGRCAGTGQFITMVLNGRPTGPGGICYRCEGKGYQSARDEERNDNYDQFAAMEALRAMCAGA